MIKIVGKIEVEAKSGKKGKKRDRTSKIVLTESPDSTKESIEKGQEPNKTREVKNFKLF